MKKTFIVCTLIATALFSSCSDNPDSLSSGKIETLVEEMLVSSGQDQGYIQIPLGYYELNNIETRYQLSRLSAAGLITYKVERYNWWNKVLQINDFWGESYGSVNYSEEKHIMVRVELTEEGKKLMVDSIPEPKPVLDEEMLQPEVNLSEFPENKITRDNYVKTFENWPAIPCPETGGSSNIHKDESSLKKDTEKSESAVEDEMEEAFEDNNEYLKQIEEYRNSGKYEVLSMDIETSSKYEAAKAKENKRIVAMKAYKLKVEKARFIQVVNTDEGVHATAEVIVQYSDVTPVCRAWRQIYNETRLCAPVTLVYFNDKGWILQEKNLHFSANSTLGKSLTETGNISGAESGSGAAKETAQE